MAEATASASNPAAIQPGRLRNYVEMTIQTRQAQRLIRGREGGPNQSPPPIIGLYRFGAMTRVLWTAASNDDPYADWCLLRVEQALTESRDTIDHMKATIDQRLGDVSSMRIDQAHSLEPVRTELAFSNPYGYMGGWLLAAMDELVLAILTARHVGLINRNESQHWLEEAGRAVRRAFVSPTRFKATAVKRKDIKAGNRRAERAREAMGDLPQSILNGKLRPEYAPSTGENESNEPSSSTNAIQDESLNNDDNR